MKTGGVFSAIKSSFNGLSTQMKRMELISENIANAGKLSGADGKVYNRKVLIENPEKKVQQNPFQRQLRLSMKQSRSNHLSSKLDGNDSNHSSSRIEKAPFKVVDVEGEKLVYDPMHPRADKNGYVKQSNVNTIEEMVDMISASRSYEANITVINAVKKMTKQAMEI